MKITIEPIYTCGECGWEGKKNELAYPKRNPALKKCPKCFQDIIHIFESRSAQAMPENPVRDMVNNVPHYTVYPIQPIEICRYLGFNLGNAVKYVLRAPYKGGVEDCNKALKYLDWEKETPQRALSVPEYLAITAKIDALSDYLHGLPGQPWMEVVTENQADFLDTLSGYLEGGEVQYIEQLRVRITRIADAWETDSCRVCGCTDDHACEGGFQWVEEDLCSACVEKPINKERGES